MVTPTYAVTCSLDGMTTPHTTCRFVFQYHIRALFSYDPAKDALLPCTQIGLPFHYGDILEVIKIHNYCLTLLSPWSGYLILQGGGTPRTKT